MYETLPGHSVSAAAIIGYHGNVWPQSATFPTVLCKDSWKSKNVSRGWEIWKKLITEVLGPKGDDRNLNAHLYYKFCNVFPRTADAGLELWEAIKSWNKEYIDIFSRYDSAVQGDGELQKQRTKFRTEAHGGKRDAPADVAQVEVERRPCGVNLNNIAMDSIRPACGSKLLDNMIS